MMSAFGGGSPRDGHAHIMMCHLGAGAALCGPQEEGAAAGAQGLHGRGLGGSISHAVHAAAHRE
jgi:hypothetical protein